MPFDTALSGIRAASSDLNVTGNNIANASTTGFKSSRVEFGDVYATSVLGAGSNATGSGVQVQDINQNFSQGNVAFTERSLDMAINGNGFFVLSQSGEQLFSRAGAFGLDDEGYVVNNTGARLQGFSADAEGNIGGIAEDVQIVTSNLEPRRTTGVTAALNLDSSDEVLQSIGRQFTTDGSAIGIAQVGRQQPTTTVLNSNAIPAVPFTITDDITFTIQHSNASANNGSVDITLSAGDQGIPADGVIDNLIDLTAVASAINVQMIAGGNGGSGINVEAEAEFDAGTGNFSLSFNNIIEGDPSDIQITAASDGTVAGEQNAADLGLATTLTSVQGIPQVSNGYPAQSLEFVDPDGNTVSYLSQVNSTAAQIASELNAIQGVNATATTTASITDYSNISGNMLVTVNGVTLASTNLDDLTTEINGFTTTSLPGISATLLGTGVLEITSSGGANVEISISGDDGDRVTVQGGNPISQAQTLEVETAGGFVDPMANDASLNAVVIGGEIELIIEEGFIVQNPVPVGTGIIQVLGDTTDPNNPLFTDVVLNDFDPADQATYNSATSMTVYDSLGNSHVLTKFFVKQSYNSELPITTTNSPNYWQMHVLIDGQDVGDPSVGERATFDVYFNDDGSLDINRTPEILITNWVPLDDQGFPNGADGPQNILAGAATPIPDPPTSSNFLVDLTGTTQFGSDFSVNNVDQTGFATGRISGISIDDSGVIFARYTNGESLTLAQVALANFPNEEGLQPVGNTMWAENFESGPVRIAPANTGSLGAIQAGALEESNVDLSAELVNLILAQRDYQASAKTIETANAVTQTIINLR